MSAADPLAEIVAALRPYRDEVPTFERLPERGRDRAAVLADLEAMAARERPRWQDGHASGAVYHGDPEHIAFLAQAYALHSQSNPLHVDLWPSTTKFEAEIVAMTADMLGVGRTDDEIAGVVSSGGTESILLAVKAHRDRAGVERPQLVLPETAHAAFDKAAHYFGVEAVEVPVGPDLRADVAAIERRSTDRTVLVVGSAPSFPHGVIDPIAELSELARARGIGFHTDACLGGFVLPFAERLGHDVAPFDFRLPGVTSMSADTHKYGYAAKGTSVVLYRGAELRHAPVLHVHRLAGRPVRVADVRRQPPGRAERGVLGGDGRRSARTATSTRRGAILEAAAAIRRGHRRTSTACACSATRCSASRSPPRTTSSTSTACWTR